MSSSLSRFFSRSGPDAALMIWSSATEKAFLSAACASLDCMCYLSLGPGARPERPLSEQVEFVARPAFLKRVQNLAYYTPPRVR